jgi:glycosyltransferase involved in cell wall biosynthesis
MVRSAVGRLPPLLVRTLVAAYERNPAQLKKEAAEIYIIDDASSDDTFWAGMGYKLLHNIPNLNVYRNPRNLGYGGNQKRGLRHAIAKDEVPFERCTEDFPFDTEILIQFNEEGMRIAEIPIPTHYGPEPHQVGFGTDVRYGRGILGSLLQYRLHKSGIRKFRSKPAS